jgi:hypothetical protein
MINEEQLINDIIENVKGMINLGVDGDAVAESDKYIVNINLVEKDKPKKYRDPLWLHDAYVVQGRSMQDIGKEFSISPTAINQWLVKLEIPTRVHKRILNANEE